MRLTVRGGHPHFPASSPMRYWLMKSEPSECSVDDVAKAAKRTVPWFGVRNYQARNFMRDDMAEGDGVLFYHSSCPQPGVAGIAEVVSGAYADATQFDSASPYFDSKSTPEAPRWTLVDVRLLKKTRLLGLAEMRAEPALAEMPLLRKGNRLSITPVSANEWKFIVRALDGTA